MSSARSGETTWAGYGIREAIYAFHIAALLLGEAWMWSTVSALVLILVIARAHVPFLIKSRQAVSM